MPQVVLRLYDVLHSDEDVERAKDYVRNSLERAQIAARLEDLGVARKVLEGLPGDHSMQCSEIASQSELLVARGAELQEEARRV